LNLKGDVMTKKQFSLMLAIALVGGFIGGIVANHLFTIPPVFAQKDIPAFDTLQVQKIQILSKDDKVVGNIGLIGEYKGNPMYGLELLNPLRKENKKQISLFAWKEGPELHFFDEKGRDRLFLALGIAGCPNLGLVGQSPKGTVHISVDKWNNGSILLAGEKSFIKMVKEFTDYSKQEIIWKAP
jgi:hypothetical protein